MMMLILPIIVAIIFYLIATVLILFLLQRFQIKLRFNPKIVVPFLMSGAFLLTVTIILTTFFHLPSLYLWLVFVLLLVISIPLYQSARR